MSRYVEIVEIIQIIQIWSKQPWRDCNLTTHDLYTRGPNDLSLYLLHLTVGKGSLGKILVFLLIVFRINFCGLQCQDG
jgi:hypothetical protein